MKYIIYNLTTGEVLKSLSASFDTIELNVSTGEGYLPYLGNNFDIHVDVETKTIQPGRIDSRSHEEKTRIEWYSVRKERDKRLIDTDWVSAKMLDQTGTITDEWRAYRQSLRDVTNQADPFNISWPLLPKI